MPLVATCTQLIHLIRQSRLIGDRRFDAFLNHFEDALPPEPRGLAGLLIRQGLLTPFQAGQLLSGKWRGFQLAGGKYRLLDLLGSGGMGAVYLCEHVTLRRLVALKVLPTPQTNDAMAVARFIGEARAIAALSHPNIVRAYDLDADGDRQLLVMEYLDGVNLHELVARHQPLEFARACHYIRQAALGLHHAHLAGWVHRDVKPGNLFLERSGRVKILDMGLARFSGGHKFDRDERGATVGTPDFIAPEQIATSGAVDARADIYSLGATFHFLLTGRPPFGIGPSNEKQRWQRTRSLEPLRAARPEIPVELEATIQCMMAFDRNARIEDMNAVAEALEPWTHLPIAPPMDAEMPRRCPALNQLLANDFHRAA